jgi:hypothetical protein
VPVLDESHDLAHPVGDDPFWSESYYFNAYAPGSDTGFFARAAVRPNAGKMDGFLWAWLPGGGAAQLAFERPQHKMLERDLEVGGVHLELIEAGKSWRLRATGELHDGRTVDADAIFTALTPMIGVDKAGQSESADEATAVAQRSLAGGHLEQAGRWSGRVIVAGETFPLDGARGNRDKSWGPRRSDGSGGMTMWRWFSANIGDDFHLGGIRIGTKAGDLHRGWVWSDGESSSVREWDITTRLGDDGVRHEALDLTVRDKRDRTHRLHGDVLRAERLGRNDEGSMIVYEGLTRWESDAGVGYGVAEYTHVLDGEGRPVRPVE